MPWLLPPIAGGLLSPKEIPRGISSKEPAGSRQRLLPAGGCSGVQKSQTVKKALDAMEEALRGATMADIEAAVVKHSPMVEVVISRRAAA